MEKYDLIQFPKNKVIDKKKLNDYQIIIRDNKRFYKYSKTKRCNNCAFELPIKEFYIKDKKTGRRNNTCRDCQMKRAGVIEIGRQRFADKIEDKGFRRCSVCKDIKPLTQFTKSRSAKNGISNNCYDCSKTLQKKYVSKQREEIGDFYVRQYCLRQHGIENPTNDEIIKYRHEIEAKRQPKYFIDGKEFLTVAEFARYILLKYKLPITMTEKRIYEGKTEEECKLTEAEMRVLMSGTCKGKIKVTDCITKKVFIFKNTQDKELLKMFSGTTIIKSIKRGTQTRVTSISRYKNPCLIERLSKK